MNNAISLNSHNPLTGRSTLADLGRKTSEQAAYLNLLSAVLQRPTPWECNSDSLGNGTADSPSLPS
ncbi:MAG: hypothetical protein CL957_04540 [Euryarchaeota archaeon]|nr:hypothetical protein [Euryarchaeota archaeon]